MIKFFDIFQNLGIKEALDLFIVFLLFYLLIRILIETKSIYLFWGLIILGGLYFVSILLELKISKLVFDNLFSIFWIIVVIVFQKEIRRFFGTLSSFFKLNEKQKLENNFIEEIIESIDSLSKEKIGSIIVFKGRDSLEPYIENGFILNGEISKPLILSIFDPHSPGHDGAVIVEGNKIKKFGVFLPLPENKNLSIDFGTRHRASIGITEKTDSLCIVTSEERGSISIIKNGELNEINDINEIKKELNNFYKTISLEFEKRSILLFIEKNILPAILSFVLIISLLFITNYKNPLIQKSFIVPIEFKNVPSNFYVENLDDNIILVTLSGKEKDFNFIDEKKLKITIDVKNAQEGNNKVLIKKEFLNIPQFLNIIKLDPEYVKFKLIKISTSTTKSLNQ